MSTHYVYRAFAADDTALYVGATYDPEKRLAAHKGHSAWWSDDVRIEITGPYTRAVSLLVEDAEIWRLGPVYNQPQVWDLMDFDTDGETAPLPGPAYGMARAAALCGVGRGTLQRAVAAGELERIRHRGRWVVLRAELERWLGIASLQDAVA